MTKKNQIEKKNVNDSKEIVDQLHAQGISDLMINRYFNHSEQLEPLLNLMDDQNILLCIIVYVVITNFAAKHNSRNKGMQ